MQNTAKGLKNWQKAVIIVLLILVGFILTLVLTMPSGSKKNASSKPRTAKVQKISLKQTLLVSGIVQSSNTRNVISKVNGAIEKIFVKNGQYVKKGDLIAKIDDSQAVFKIEALKRQLLDLELQRENFQRQLQNFTLKSPQDGFVQNLTTSEGMFVSQEMQVMTIVDDSKMKLSVQLPAWCYGKVKRGQKAEVVVSDLMDRVDGVVEGLGSRIYKNQDGVMVFDAKVVVSNKNGSLTEGMRASVSLKLSNGEKVTSLSEGILEVFSKKIIVSPVSGRVEKVFVENGQKVKTGSLLLKFSTDEVEMQIKQLDLKIEDIKSQIKAAEDDLKNYEVLAPIDGKIADLNLQDGDVVTVGQMICSVYDPKHLVISAQVEELDILKIKPGQKVNIKLDAVGSTRNRPLEGYVAEISEKAQSDSNGSVSKFVVKIEFENNSNIKIGMHAEAEIILKSKENALVVPVEAVHKDDGKYYVYVYPQQKAKTSEKNKEQKTSQKTDEYGLDSSYYKDAEKRAVKLGMTTDKYVEILEGLIEGEEVVLPKFDTEKQGQSLFY
ncbi:RND family efflux transporter MFP subunit [Caldicellulosiruptor bescii]|uniref:Efflux transporter, RND family, MFP subunit n=2 Tax=Caldicellulosiruptor bescii TaxID=31899 RepID=B9MPP3_CALBD|nr:HlyD family efflux transporter periplasmic adaptor subunit [Caldicellulosiruptor bescii]ACM61676.1 efflux transporter, RND family, MFP subunit [Caldicellulosiruptor bescii DSM 6725]PBC88520.1 RND family efflux transporter MFP subunit [Caldicellulosiruptor bescii]PBC91998.1 RND family efflux transporter MFP subunit [Caldicellulosiruptor bescii]PBD02589.1 RND family efflux transporter MFP subunit [Caldicellulosiruptor bescii]PBD05177.1 RND family efflux transporter MFP subunit [Caldicellulosi